MTFAYFCLLCLPFVFFFGFFLSCCYCYLLPFLLCSNSFCSGTLLRSVDAKGRETKAIPPRTCSVSIELGMGVWRPLAFFDIVLRDVGSTPLRSNNIHTTCVSEWWDTCLCFTGVSRTGAICDLPSLLSWLYMFWMRTSCKQIFVVPNGCLCVGRSSNDALHSRDNWVYP